MKATGLEGEYCQSCASLLDAYRRTPTRVIVICGGCVGVFHQSGDYNRLDPYAAQLKVGKEQPADEPDKPAETPKEEPKPKPEPKPEPKKPARKPAWRRK